MNQSSIRIQKMRPRVMAMLLFSPYE
jgi:hypothetical protein